MRQSNLCLLAAAGALLVSFTTIAAAQETDAGDQFVRVDETLDRVEALRGGTAPIFNSGAIGARAAAPRRPSRDGCSGWPCPVDRPRDWQKIPQGNCTWRAAFISGVSLR